ncbi:Venom serine protease Bi-VSP [Lucilia cuprina]|nr:Venom serine protease Bi-VSP [Lucilia cuprina]
MKLYTSLTIIVVACITTPVLSQRWQRQQQQQQQQAQYCITPENYNGFCVNLSFCPQIASVIQNGNQTQVKQYLIQSQKACNTESVNNDPVVCCSKPLNVPQTTIRPKRQTTCRGPDLKMGTCIPIRDCKPLREELLTKQQDPTFFRFLKASNFICGGKATAVCCPSNDSQPQTFINVPSIKNSNEIPRRLPTIEEGCGFSNNTFKKKLGGEESRKGAWPWIALIGYDNELSTSPFKCGGILITARHVVTAAHCLRRDLSFVRLGELDLTTDTEGHHVDIRVVRSERHPDYSPTNGHSDIAILYLERNVEFSAQYCVTPENYYGSCVTLSFCPQIANVFQSGNQRQAQQYVILSQRACGTRSVNGDPVVCCTRPLNVPQTTARPQRQTQNPFQPQPPQTTPSVFFPNTEPQTNPQNPFLNPATRAPVPVAPPTSAPTRSPQTQRPTTNGNLIDNRASTCRGPDAKVGICMPIRECQPLVEELLMKQQDATFARFLQVSNSICGGAATAVCCPSSNSQQQTSTNAPLIKNSNEIPRRLPTVEEGCGFSNNSYKKIVGGEVSKKGAWPWIALIGYDDELSASPFKCGGTLITARHVVTAAHCLRRDLSFVRLGEHDLTTDTEARHVDIRVVRSERHPDYTPRNGHSDIAILYLERNVEFSVLISPICMPITPELRKKTYVRYTPFIAGWGKTMEGGTSSNVLEELQVTIYENELCRDRYKQKNRLFPEKEFDNAVICAGLFSGRNDTCQGDSGGPLMIPEINDYTVRFYLIGVSSYGFGCGLPEIPEFISPICMPITPELRQKSYVRYTPFVIGWGKTMEGGTSSNVLQELQIPIYDNQVCRDRYKQQNRLFTENQFDRAVLCAGVLSGGKDTCQGDSGGPLMIPENYGNNVRFYLIGVVSYGIGCARPEIPGVYSSTQFFIDWIAQKVADTP